MANDPLTRFLKWATPTINPDVYGRVDIRGRSGRASPAAEIDVELLSWDGRDWTATDTARTDQNGAYHFRNVPPGDHALLIRDKRFSIKVEDKGRVDIEPIVLP